MFDNQKKNPNISTDTKIKISTNPEFPEKKVIDNANDGEYPQELPSIAQEVYYYILNQAALLWYGDRKAIEYTGKVDLDYYCQMLRWDIETAISLSLGQSPRKVKKYWPKFHAEFQQQWEQRRVLLNQAISYRIIQHESAKTRTWIIFSTTKDVVKPYNFLKWAKNQKWELFFGMEEMVKKYTLQGDIDFEERCIELEKEIRQLKYRMNSNNNFESNPLGIRREESYQKLIAGLARLKFSNLESINASNITNQLAELDLPFNMISEDTIRTLLEPSRRMLGVKKPNPNTKK